MKQETATKTSRVFCAGSDGSKCRRSSGLTLEYCRVVYQKIREVIVVQLDVAFPEPGFFEVVESYFGGTRPNSLRIGTIISMGSKTFRARPNACYESIMAFRLNLLVPVACYGVT